MKKLTVLVAVILIAGLLAGCWVLPESKLDKIVADPDEVTLYLTQAAGNTQQLEVTAYYEDKTCADVTPSCDYNSSLSNTAGLAVSDEGLITAKNEGEATILVTYTQHNAWTGRIIRTDEVDVTVEY